jgi:excisionase family DNA binding protein
MNTTDNAASRKADDSFPKLLVSAEELATILDVSQRTIWRLLSARKIPNPVRFGGTVRWRLAQVSEWIEQGCPQPMES